MADPQIPGLPEGASLAPMGTAAQSAQPQAAPIPGLPEGATLAPMGTAAGAQPNDAQARSRAYLEAQRQTAVDSHDMGAAPPSLMTQARQKLGDFEEGARGVAQGAVQSISQAGLTAAQLASKVPGVHGIMQHIPGLSDESLKAVDESKALSPTNNFQRVGYGGAELATWLMGEGGVKSAGGAVSEGLANSSKVMKVVEKMPKVQQALQYGANLMEDAAKLGPAEKAFVQAHPWLARFVPVGAEAAAAGTTSAVKKGAETMAEHQATPGEEGTVAELGKSAAAGTKAGAVEGVKTGLLTAGIGGTIAGAGGMLSKITGGVENVGKAARTAAETVQGATKAAETAPESQSIADMLKSHLEGANKQLHTDFESKIQKVAADVPDTVPLHETPLVQTAKDLLEAEKPVNKGALEQSGGALEPLSEKAKNLLKPLSRIADAAEKDPEAATEQVGVSELIGYRQKVRAASAKLDWNAPEKPIYQKVMDSIDDTIQDMADKSGNPQAAEDYKAARAAYKDQVKNFQNTDVKAFMAGEKGGPSQISDIVGRLNRGETAASDLRALRATVGDDAMNKVSDKILQRTMADAQTNGTFDPAKFLKTVEKWPTASKAELFKDAPVNLKQIGLRLEAAPKDMKSPLATLNLTNTAGENVGSFQTTTPEFDPKGVQIKGAVLTDELKGKGIGKSVYEQLIQQAKAEGKTALYSDSSVEPEAQHVWESLAKRYNVTKVNTPDGMVSKLDLATPRNTPLERIMSDTKNARTMQILTKAGLITTGGAVGLGSGAALGLLAPMIEVAAAGAGAGGGIVGAAKLMDYVANNPKTWNMLKNVGQAVETTGRVAGKAVNAVSKVAPKVVGAESGTRTKQNMMSDLASSMGGTE
jgi:hypothetical protein